MKDPEKIVTDIVVVGSGAAGATLAKELAQTGRVVTLVEKGKDSTWPVGKIFSLMTLYDHSLMPPFIPKAKEGSYLVRGICTGGCTTIFGGNAYLPPPWLEKEYDIDLTNEAQEAIEEIGIGVPPKEYYDAWRQAERFKEAAGEVGISVVPQLKFIYPGKCPPSCDHCPFGCEKGARWSAREFVKKAADNGAKVLVQTDVREVIIDGNHAVGVKAKGAKGPVDIYANKVVLAAGGIGTPIILQRSGIGEAGDGLTVDPSWGVYGITKESWESGGTFASSCEETVESEGFMISNVGASVASFVRLSTAPLKALLHPRQFKKVFGTFVKISDSGQGRVYENGTISKPFNKEDEEKMNKGIELAKKILIKGGCDPNSFFISKPFGSHYCGTAAIDRVVDRNLETRVEKLYVCDTSILPRSPGRPPALTAIALGKWFAKRL